MPTSNRNVTALELFVTAYLRQTSRRSIGKKYIQKAVSLIDQKLGIPCCEDPTATINLYTRFDNLFSTTVAMMLEGLPKTGNVQSLTRVKRKLNNFITPPCCA